MEGETEIALFIYKYYKTTRGEFKDMLLSLTISAIVIGSVYGLIALGYSLIYSASGLMTFCQGEILMFGAFIGLTFFRYLEWPFLIALLLTMLIMFVLGMLIERLLIRPILSRHATDIYIVLATIALGIVITNVAQQIWGTHAVQFPAIFGVDTINILGTMVQPEAFVCIFVGAFAMLGIHLFMNKMKFGTSMRAAAMSPMAARSVGINVDLTTGITWGMSCALAGVAGILLGPVQGVSISMGSTIGTKAFAAAVIGGYGNMYGAIIGGLIIGFTETFSAAYITSDYKDFITYGLLALCMVFLPRGILKGDVYDR
ncbi:MAG TPA: branched-chain amino acid ABC transporter permease [Candidatus Blautia excrementipullorum]|nr:branched-chain amino acid ABC transporter permease [Candidatus Blautia excrementipullorum]